MNTTKRNHFSKLVFYLEHLLEETNKDKLKLEEQCDDAFSILKSLKMETKTKHSEFYSMNPESDQSITEKIEDNEDIDDATREYINKVIEKARIVRKQRKLTGEKVKTPPNKKNNQFLLTKSGNRFFPSQHHKYPISTAISNPLKNTPDIQNPEEIVPILSKSGTKVKSLKKKESPYGSSDFQTTYQKHFCPSDKNYNKNKHKNQSKNNTSQTKNESESQQICSITPKKTYTTFETCESVSQQTCSTTPKKTYTTFETCESVSQQTCSITPKKTYTTFETCENGSQQTCSTTPKKIRNFQKIENLKKHSTNFQISDGNYNDTNLKSLEEVIDIPSDVVYVLKLYHQYLNGVKSNNYNKEVTFKSQFMEEFNDLNERSMTNSENESVLFEQIEKYENLSKSFDYRDLPQEDQQMFTSYNNVKKLEILEKKHLQLQKLKVQLNLNNIMLDELENSNVDETEVISVYKTLTALSDISNLKVPMIIKKD